MQTEILIVGAGISGLLAAIKCEQLGIGYVLVNPITDIVPAKIHYLHRDLSADLGVPMKPIFVVNNILWNGKLYLKPTIEMMNSYSMITTGKINQNTMVFGHMFSGAGFKQFVPLEGIDKISMLLYSKLHQNIVRGIMVAIEPNFATFDNDGVGVEYTIKFERCISTVPLPNILPMTNIAAVPKFEYEPLKMVEVEFERRMFGEVFQIVYIPQAYYGYSRFSVLGNRVVVEKAVKNYESVETGQERVGVYKLVEKFLGIESVRSIKSLVDYSSYPGRWVQIDESERLRIIAELAGNYSVYQVGRFAEWAYRCTEDVWDKLNDTFKTWGYTNG